jgi:hypothetical protein
MTPEQKQDQAISLTLRAQKNVEPKDAFIRAELNNAFGGSLYTVTYTNGKDGRTYDNFVFFEKNSPHHFFNPNELTRFLSSRSPKNQIINLMREVFTVGGAPAVIAIVITGTICYLAISPNNQPTPDILGHALTTILGFYFGSKVSREKDSSKDKSSDLDE